MTRSTVKPLVFKVLIFGFPVLSCSTETKLEVSLHLKSALLKKEENKDWTVFHRTILILKVYCCSMWLLFIIVIECNMHGIFRHFLSSHYCTTASHCTLWRTNSFNSLKVDPEVHWIKSDMTVM